jgi:cytidylate kinase
MKKIITISREFGAGGGEIGRALAKKLNYEFYDKELILKAARTHHVDVESMIKWDEKVPVNFGFAQSLFDFYNKPLSEKLFQAQSSIIKEIAEKENCVILGRNANSILREYDNGLHVFVCADAHWRVERMRMKQNEESDSKVIEEMRSVDKARKKYCSYYTNTEFGVADYYDICLNTSQLGISACVDVLYQLVK